MYLPASVSALLSLFPNVQNVSPYAAPPLNIADFSLYIVHLYSRASQGLNGLYLFEVYNTAVPNTIIKQREIIDRSPLGKTMPRIVAEAVQDQGNLGFLCEIGTDIAHTISLQSQIDGPAANVADLQAVISALAEAIQSWNPVRDLDYAAFPGLEWFRRLTSFGSVSSASKTVLVGNRVFRNPVAYSVYDELWDKTPPIIMPTGYVHGRLDIPHILCANKPFVVDARYYQSNAPILFDWATLELSTLLYFMVLETAHDWVEWLSLCETLSYAIAPSKSPSGRNAPHAAALVTPLRNAVSAYIAEMPSTMSKSIETSYWLSATIAALRLLADPAIDDTKYKAAMVYAAYAFDQVAKELQLSMPVQTPDILSFEKALSLTPVLMKPRRSAKFEHGYALIIGVGQTADPQLTLSVTRTDALVLAEFLQKSTGYLPDHVTVLTDEKATAAGIEAGFTWLIQQVNSDPNATVIVYYSGHGAEFGSDSKYYLIPYETDLTEISSTAISMHKFNDWIEDTRAKRLAVFLDCCHAGSATLTKNTYSLPFISKAPNPAALISGSGRALIASSTESQFSHILKGHSNSLFTEVLLEVLSSPGEVEVLDAFKILRDQVAQRAIAAGVEQTPRFNAANLDRIVLSAKQ